MTTKIQDRLVLLARILMVPLFVLSGLSKVSGFERTVGYIVSKGLPMPEVGAVIAIAIELGGGMALLVGFHTRLVAAVMALFTVVAAIAFHNFWAVPPAELVVNQVMFLKNLSIAGGLAMLVAFGPGGISLDARDSNR